MLSLSILLALQVATPPVPAHPTATATSGPPQLIAHIRAEYGRIQRDLPSLRKVTRTLTGFSEEGGELTAYLQDSVVRKVSTQDYGETWRGQEEDYYENGRLFFSLIVHEVYDQPLSGRVAVRIEHRYYFSGDTLVRLTRVQRPAHTRVDYSWRDPDPDGVLKDAIALLACAAASTDDDEACTAAAQ